MSKKRGAISNAAHSQRWTRACDAAGVTAVGASLVGAVLAVGSVQYWGRGLIQVGAAVVGMLWSLRMLLSRRRRVRCSAMPRALPALVAGFIFFTLIPLPPSVVRALSPNAFALYLEALPGWPERPPFSDLLASIELPPVELSSMPAIAHWRPLALAPLDSVETLLAGAAYAVIGGAVAFYPWPRGGLRGVNRIATVLIGIATFQAMYGFLQFSSHGSSRRMLWYDCQRDCLGTYLNRDHYAGLLEMILPLALARAAIAASEVKHRDSQGKIRNSKFEIRNLNEPALARMLIAISIALLILVALALSTCRSAFGAALAAMAIMIPLRPRKHSELGVLGGNVVTDPPPHPINEPEAGSLKSAACSNPEARTLNPVRSRGTYLAVILALAAALWLSFPEFFARLEGTTVDKLRVAAAADTFDIAWNFPLFGIGLGNFGTTFSLYRSRTSELYAFGVSDAHNDYLQWTAETGFPVALITLVLLVLFGRRVGRALRSTIPSKDRDATTKAMLRWGFACGVLTLLFHSLSDFNLHIPANALVFSVLVGALIRLTTPPEETNWQHQDSKRAATPPSPSRRGLGRGDNPLPNSATADPSGPTSTREHSYATTTDRSEIEGNTHSPRPSPLLEGEGRNEDPTTDDHPQMTRMNTDRRSQVRAICDHLRNLWIGNPTHNPMLRAFVVKIHPTSRLIPSLGLALCAIWLVLTCQSWAAEAAYRQVYPDFRLRDLAVPWEQLPREQELQLARQAAAAVPASPNYQWGLGDRLVQVAYPALHNDPDRAATVIDEAVQAYIRSLWSRPAQPQVLFDLLKAAEEVYVPDNGPEPDLLLDIAGRANNFAPYNAALRLEIADWYLSQWPNLTPATRVRVKNQVQATLKFATTQPHVRQQYEQTAATLNRLLEEDASKPAQTARRAGRIFHHQVHQDHQAEKAEDQSCSAWCPWCLGGDILTDSQPNPTCETPVPPLRASASLRENDCRPTTNRSEPVTCNL